jgi:hypothetical protein
MYNLYIMRRTQIYLTEEQGTILEGRSKATGHTISELIRAAVDNVYTGSREMSRSERERIARKTAGAWTDYPESGAEYVDRVRGGRRLARVRSRR